MSAVTSGSKRFFLGTDSAPHDRRKKECSCGCAGIFNAFVALSVYAKVFEEVVSPSTSPCLFQLFNNFRIQLQFFSFRCVALED